LMEARHAGRWDCGVFAEKNCAWHRIRHFEPRLILPPRTRSCEFCHRSLLFSGFCLE
jgi:hypothetical protein